MFVLKANKENPWFSNYLEVVVVIYHEKFNGDSCQNSFVSSVFEFWVPFFGGYFRTAMKMKSLAYSLYEENVMKLAMWLCNCHLSESVAKSPIICLWCGSKAGSSNMSIKGQTGNI